MATRKALVLGSDGLIQQLQSGDTLDGLSGVPDSPIPGGRLTLATGDALPSADQTAKTTVYYTPFLNNCIQLYDGTSWTKNFMGSEKSVAVPSTTSTPFDVFGYLSSGDLALETINWTNDTTRATNLATQDGFRVKSGDATRLYLGTCRTTGVSGQCEDSKTTRFVWNAYNRQPRMLIKATSGNGYTYSTFAYRKVNNDSTNRVEVMVGLSEAYIELQYLTFVTNTAATFAAACSIGLDSETVNSAKNQMIEVGIANAGVMCQALQQGILTAGFHYLAALERGAGSGTQTWFNNADQGFQGYIMA